MEFLPLAAPSAIRRVSNVFVVVDEMDLSLWLVNFKLLFRGHFPYLGGLSSLLLAGVHMSSVQS